MENKLSDEEIDKIETRIKYEVRAILLKYSTKIDILAVCAILIHCAWAILFLTLPRYKVIQFVFDVVFRSEKNYDDSQNNSM